MSALEQYQAECAAGKIAAKDREIVELRERIAVKDNGLRRAIEVIRNCDRHVGLLGGERARLEDAVKALNA